MKLNRQQVRQQIKDLKKQKVGDFRREMNEMHTRAYELAAKHYQEAMSCLLPPKEMNAVIAKANEIRELWDGIKEITVEETVRDLT